MNVCFVTEDFYPDFIGGQGIYGKNLVRQLARLDVKITVLAEKRPEREAFWKSRENVELITVPYCFANQVVLGCLEYAYFILRCTNKHYDIVHTNQLSGLFFGLFKPKNVGKIIVSAHNTFAEMREYAATKLKGLLYIPLVLLEQVLYKRADAIICNSPAEKESLIRHFGLEDGRIKPIYLGVESKKYPSGEKKDARSRVRRELRLDRDIPIVLYVGRLVRKKRVETLIRALTLLARQSYSVAGVIVGKGEDRTRLEKMAAENSHFLGFVQDPKPYFLAADCFVTTGVAEGGIALSVLEAASYGLPLILSPSDAGCPIIKQGENGYIVHPDNPKSLVEAIKKVVASKEKMSKLSKKLSRQFSWEKCARQTLAFYQKVRQK